MHNSRSIYNDIQEDFEENNTLKDLSNLHSHIYMFSFSNTRINTHTMLDPYFLRFHGCVNSIICKYHMKMLRRNIRKN